MIEMVKEAPAISGIKVWGEYEDRIPGTTRVPVKELQEALKGTKVKIGLDLGCGSGRSTTILKEGLGCKVVALDLSLTGLGAALATKEKVQARGEALPFDNETFDFVNICGVMTNLTDRNPGKAQKMRNNLAKETFRCLNERGVAVVSDFCAQHELSRYPVNYRRHSLITGEKGTIAVFKPEAKITFIGLSDEAVKQLAHSEHLERFAHHYLPEELVEIFNKAGFRAIKYTTERGETPSGTPIDTIILTAVKPKGK